MFSTKPHAAQCRTKLSNKAWRNPFHVTGVHRHLHKIMFVYAGAKIGLIRRAGNRKTPFTTQANGQPSLLPQTGLFGRKLAVPAIASATSRGLAWKPADANTRGTRYTCGVHTLLACPNGNPNSFALHICDWHCCGCTHGNCQGALRHMYVGRTCSTLANGSCADGHVARVHMANGEYAQTIFMGDEEKIRSLYCFVQSGPSSVHSRQEVLPMVDRTSQNFVPTKSDKKL